MAGSLSRAIFPLKHVRNWALMVDIVKGRIRRFTFCVAFLFQRCRHSSLKLFKILFLRLEFWTKLGSSHFSNGDGDTSSENFTIITNSRVFTFVSVLSAFVWQIV